MSLRTHQGWSRSALAVLEAMAAGLPCVVYAEGAFVEILSQDTTGLLVEPGNIDGLRQAILSLRDREKRTAIAQAAQQAVQTRFCPTDAGQAFARLVRNTSLRISHS